MTIAVCVKQVPRGHVEMDPERGVLLRKTTGNRLNPWDIYAIEAALQAAEATGSRVCAVTMGAPCAAEALREALAMGVHRAVLLTDAAFAGADVWATAFTLAQGLQALGGFDLVFCGQQSTDGDTAQLPFSLAVQLRVTAAGWVKKIESVTDSGITVLQELSGGTQRLYSGWPVVAAVGDSAVRPRMASLKTRLAARGAPITTLHLADMPRPQAALYGLAASPTRVVKVYPAAQTAKNPPLRLTANQAAARLLAEAKEAGHEP